MKISSLNILKFLFISFLVFTACNNDDDVTLTEANHRVIVTSEMNFENTINVGGHIDFADLLSGIASREWTFPEGVSSISGSDKNTSSKDVVKGIFNTPGTHNVTLHQVFKGDVYPNEDSTVPNAGKELDTTIVVTVLGEVKASIKAHYINDDGSTGAELTLADNAENEIIASKSVRLSYTTEGAPTSFVWTLDGGKPATVSNAEPETDVKYSKLGSWDLKFIASRARPGGSDTISIKKFIKVIPSTEPVTLDKVSDKAGKIALEFSREMDAATLNKNNFTVKIETKAGPVISPVIQTATVDATEGNIVLLTLDNETMYNDDIVKVSYTPGILSTADAVLAGAFTDVVLQFNKTNILASTSVDYSFETTTATNWPYLFWGAPWDQYDMNMSSARAHTGSKSMYVELRPNGGMVIGNTDAGSNVTFPVESGFNYEMGAWVYVVDLGTPTTSNIRMYWRPTTNWGVGDNPTFSAATTPVGQWVYTSTIVQFAADGNESFIIRGQNVNPQTLKFYLDDLTLYKLTSRP